MRQGFGSVIMGVAEKEDVDFALAELTESGLDLLKMGMVKVFLIPIGEIIG
ncbi:MAG: hypothetical protein GX157_03310 [Candidatus Cloacimonetes bacterium]|nr:hypothetical protein [Candidatus Cloacimonadota bacterium]